MSAAPKQQPLQIEFRFQGREKLLLVEETDFVVGRSSKLKVSIDSHNISREHLRVQIMNDKIWITDLSSTNGTFLSGKRLQAQVSAEYRGEELWIGPLGEGVMIRFTLGNGTRDSMPSAPMERTETRTIPPPRPGTVQNRLNPDALRKGSSKPESEISVDSKFLLRESLASDSSVQFQGQAVQGAGGHVIDPYAIEAGTKREQLLDLERKRLRADKELAELQREARRVKDQTEDTLREAEQKRKEHHEHEQQLVFFRKQIEEYRALISALETDEKRLRDSAVSAQKHADELLRRRDEIEAAYHAEEARINGNREALKVQETEQNRKVIELHAELERIQTESDYIRKKVKIETETLQAEAQLRKAQTEKEIEELRGRKAAVERELDSLVVRSEKIRDDLEAQDEESARLDQENQELQAQITETRMAIVHSENRRKQLEAEAMALSDRMLATKDECKRIVAVARGSADEIVRKAHADAEHILEENRRRSDELRVKREEEIRLLRESTERELREREDHLLKDIADDRREAEESVRQYRLEAERSAEAIRSIAESEANRVREEAQAQAEALREKVEAELAALRQTCLEECAGQKGMAQGEYERSMKEIELRRQELEAELKTTRQKQEDVLALQRQDATDELDHVRRQAKEEHAKLDEELAQKRRSVEVALEKARIEWETEHAALKEKAQQEYEATVRETMHSRKECAEQIQKEKSEWEAEHTAQRAKFQREQEQAIGSWRHEMEQTRLRDLEALQAWRAEQDRKVQENFSGDMDTLVHAIADATLMKLQVHPNQMISKTELMNTLEPHLKEVLTTEASVHGPFNPNVKVEAKRFWKDVTRKAAIAVGIVVALATVPPIVMKRFEEAKANRTAMSDSSDIFVKRLKEARAKQMELNLQLRTDFQDSYTNNILFNEAYLELKQDPKIQKEWVIKLYQFFFEVLQMPDRVVVDFIPMESNLVRSLADLRKAMNSRNFKASLEQMKSIEKKKLEQEIFVLLSGTLGPEQGRKHWVKIRELEAEFYGEKLSVFQNSQEKRALASEILAPSSSDAEVPPQQ